MCSEIWNSLPPPFKLERWLWKIDNTVFFDIQNLNSKVFFSITIPNDSATTLINGISYSLSSIPRHYSSLILCLLYTKNTLLLSESILPFVNSECILHSTLKSNLKFPYARWPRLCFESYNEFHQHNVLPTFVSREDDWIYMISTDSHCSFKLHKRNSLCIFTYPHNIPNPTTTNTKYEYAIFQKCFSIFDCPEYCRYPLNCLLLLLREQVPFRSFDTVLLSNIGRDTVVSNLFISVPLFSFTNNTSNETHICLQSFDNSPLPNKMVFKGDILYRIISCRNNTEIEIILPEQQVIRTSENFTYATFYHCKSNSLQPYSLFKIDKIPQHFTDISCHMRYPLWEIMQVASKTYFNYQNFLQHSICGVEDSSKSEMEYTPIEKRSVHVDGIGIFNSLPNGAIHILFEDRTMLIYPPNQDQVKIIARDGQETTVRTSRPLSFRRYVEAALEFQNWLVQSAEDYEFEMQTKNDFLKKARDCVVTSRSFLLRNGLQSFQTKLINSPSRN